ncbi:MAG: hypothetical protein FWC51_01410 [Proteobacteria bacterium]|nr:hypothetical protein [Pseudomonadota bacterium]
MINKIITGFAMAAALTGCATIFNSGPKAVYVSGESKDTFTLTRDGAPIQKNITLPSTVMVPNGWNDYALKNSKGEVCPIGRTVNAATFLNLLWGYGVIVGAGIDAATGDMVRAKGQAYCNI